MRNFFALIRARRTMRQVYRLYRRKASALPPSDKLQLEAALLMLQHAIVQKEGLKAKQLARELETLTHRLVHKTLWDKTRDTVLALAITLIAAIAIRQTCFEFYTIPTGSMRPTFKEEDMLVVSKTDFGINTLTTTSHFYFDPSLVQRGSIVIFSVDHMDVPNADTVYFYLIPGKKQFIKRLIGKPGDTLYFYGGRIYGIDQEGNDLKELRDAPYFASLEHIPFIHFEGDMQMPSIPLNGIFTPVTFRQMGENVAKLSAHVNRTISGEMLVPNVKNYSDLWGFKHFATARITGENGNLSLELTHHPSLQNAKIEKDLWGRLYPALSTTVSKIPLDGPALDELMNHMTTARFTVQGGKAFRLGAQLQRTSPAFKGVPDGTYEILDGQLSKIFWGGISKRLGKDHPLLRPENAQLLYNLGIEFDTRCPWTSRYAYFRNGDLYLMGAPILKKGDPLLDAFALSQQSQPNGFIDAGAPLRSDGSLDQDLIRKFGITVPPGSYLVLGDNHAMSGDSRQFGFVPAANLRGGASFLFWPPGKRLGLLPQPRATYLTLPNLVAWGTLFSIVLLLAIYYRYKARQPLYFK